MERDRIARAIASEMYRQDEGDLLEPPAAWDLKWRWVDQGEVDFGKIADAVLAALSPQREYTGEGCCVRRWNDERGVYEYISPAPPAPTEGVAAADRVAALESALRPFSEALGDIAGPDKERWPDDSTIEFDGFPEHITVGDLRRARAALSDGGDHAR